MADQSNSGTTASDASAADGPNSIGAMAAGMAAAAGMFQSAAIVGALLETNSIDPQKVAAWAEMFADGQSQKLSPDLRDAVAKHLKGFAQLIRSMPPKPPAPKA